MFTYVTFPLAAPPFSLTTVALGWLFVVYLVGAVVTPFAGHWIDALRPSRRPGGRRWRIGVDRRAADAGAVAARDRRRAGAVSPPASSSRRRRRAATSARSTTQDRGLAVGLYSTFYYVGGSVGGALPALVWNRGGWPACVALVRRRAARRRWRLR